MDAHYDGQSVHPYAYRPNDVAAGIFIAIFGIATVGHFVKMCRLRMGHFIPFILGGVMEAFGYYGRFWSSQDPTNFKAFILQLLLILAAPIFLAGSVYSTLGRMIRALRAEQLSMISPRWLTALFVGIDVLCFIIQMGGAGMQATTSTKIQGYGRTVVLIGLIVQLVALSWFIAIAWTFFKCLSSKPVSPPLVWKRFVLALVAACSCMALRNIVRVAEYAEGPQGYVISHEAFTYVFDALPIALAMYLLLAYHPGRLIRRALKFEKDFEGDVQPLSRL